MLPPDPLGTRRRGMKTCTCSHHMPPECFVGGELQVGAYCMPPHRILPLTFTLDLTSYWGFFCCGDPEDACQMWMSIWTRMTRKRDTDSANWRARVLLFCFLAVGAALCMPAPACPECFHVAGGFLGKG